MNIAPTNPVVRFASGTHNVHPGCILVLDDDSYLKVFSSPEYSEDIRGHEFQAALCDSENLKELTAPVFVEARELSVKEVIPSSKVPAESYCND